MLNNMDHMSVQVKIYSGSRTAIISALQHFVLKPGPKVTFFVFCSAKFENKNQYTVKF